MCGIAGIVSNATAELETRLHPMVEAHRHRGPDDAGLWSDSLCGLGHRRLSIIDLSPAGHQPLSNRDGTIWITFNGEIYNFQELRARLEHLGHSFRTRTDTEVLVAAYEQWETDCPRYLRGMFAFGIWDQRRRRLFLARDRVGKKPLFYTQAGSEFLFASELQGLLANPEVPRQVNVEAIDFYLSWGYIPAPDTAFRGIHKLPPGHWLTWEADGRNRLQVERYWELHYGPKLRISEAEAAERLRETLTEAVRLRMISDVPLGAFLSGGIDSSIVVGLMAGLSGQPVKTFSIGFKEAAFDETAHARRVARRWGADHHEFVVEPDALAILPLLVRHYGEPYADSSALPTYYVSRLTRTGVTVALNGDGGDENFAGYERYFGAGMAERIRRLPGSAAMLRAMSAILPREGNPKGQLARAQRFASAASQQLSRRYGRWVTYFDEPMKQRLYGGEMRTWLERRRPLEWMDALFASCGDLHPIDAAMSVDVRSYLPFDLLVKVDITSMANALEARSPFLDHEVMEFAARLPVAMKLRGRQSKYLLKRSFADLLPRENANRPKMGFGVPVGEWFRGSLRIYVQDTLLSQRALQRGYFEPHALRELLDAHLAGRADHRYLLWNLLMLELWNCEFIDSAPPVFNSLGPSIAAPAACT